MLFPITGWLDREEICKAKFKTQRISTVAPGAKERIFRSKRSGVYPSDDSNQSRSQELACTKLGQSTWLRKRNDREKKRRGRFEELGRNGVSFERGRKNGDHVVSLCRLQSSSQQKANLTKWSIDIVMRTENGEMSDYRNGKGLNSRAMSKLKPIFPGDAVPE